MGRVTEIDARNKGIASLKGIEYFTNLKTLYCENNQLSSLDVSKNTALEALLCSGNPLTSLNMTENTALTVLDVRDCLLASLDVTKNNALETLYCQNNQLRTLDITWNPLLRNLWCYGNSISLLSISENPRLLDAYLNGDETVYDDDGTYRAYELEEENNFYLYVDLDTEVRTSPITAPVITTQPSNQTVAAGKTATFKVVATGTGLTYQWQYSQDNGSTWKNKSGATSASYSVAPKETDSGLLYHCIVTNAGGSVTSNSAKLTVTAAAAAAPTISSVKAGVTSAKTGETITWTAKASGGTGTLQYYFILYKDGTKVKTQAYSTKNTFSYAPTKAGSYKVKVYVKDATGEKVYKTSAKITVS